MKIASLLSAALITLPLALFAAPNPFDIVNLKGATDKANPVGYEIGHHHGYYDGFFKPTGGESKSQNASLSVK